MALVKRVTFNVKTQEYIEEYVDDPYVVSAEEAISTVDVDTYNSAIKQQMQDADLKITRAISAYISGNYIEEDLIKIKEHATSQAELRKRLL